MPLRLSKLTPIIFNMELTHLGSYGSKYKLVLVVECDIAVRYEGLRT